jgi:hypothetical protein
MRILRASPRMLHPRKMPSVRGFDIAQAQKKCGAVGRS